MTIYYFIVPLTINQFTPVSLYLDRASLMIIIDIDIVN